MGVTVAAPPSVLSGPVTVTGALTVTGQLAAQGGIIGNGGAQVAFPNGIAGGAAGTISTQNNLVPGNTAAAGPSIWAGGGAPGAGLGANGDTYINATGAALTTLYQKRGGAWVGIV